MNNGGGEPISPLRDAPSFSLGSNVVRGLGQRLSVDLGPGLDNSGGGGPWWGGSVAPRTDTTGDEVVPSHPPTPLTQLQNKQL